MFIVLVGPGCQLETWLEAEAKTTGARDRAQLPQRRILKDANICIHVTTSELVVVVSVASVMCMVVLEKHGFVGEVAGKGDGGYP